MQMGAFVGIAKLSIHLRPGCAHGRAPDHANGRASFPGVRKRMKKPMMGRPKGKGDVWTAEEVQLLQQMASERLPVSLIRNKLGRTVRAIEGKAHELGIALKKPGQSRLRAP